MNFVDMPDKLTKSNEDNELFVTGEKAIGNAIKNILETSPGSVPGHPEFGCKVDNYLFELIDPLISKMIEEEIKYAMKRWEPRVTITKVLVNDDPDYNRLIIKIGYIIIRDPTNTEREYIFSSLREN